MYISLFKNIRWGLTYLHGFQLLGLAAIVHRNRFFHLYQQNESSESKVKSNSRVFFEKEFLKLSIFAYPNKQKSPSSPRNLALRTLGKLLIVFLTKVNLLYLFYLVIQRCYLLHQIKQNCLLKTFIRTFILMAQLSLYLLSLLELIWNCIIFLQPPKWLKGHNEPWFVKGIWSWLYSSGGS